MKKLLAGAGAINITPQKPMFLHGYPHVERVSEGTHDPLYAAALILDNGETQIGFCTADVLYISAEITREVRRAVQEKTGIDGKNLMISATHTHSGPVTVSDIFYDPVVPRADEEYIAWLREKLVRVYVEAYQNRKESKIGFAAADALGIGGNRRSKTDAVDPEVPIVVLRDSDTDKIFAMSTVYCMHPTVLHEDSKLYSADFPGYTREYIKKEFGEDIVFLYHTGPAGNQSPRHFIKSNSFAEAERLGTMLGKRIADSVLKLDEADFKDWVVISAKHTEVMLPEKKFMKTSEAEQKVNFVKNKLDRMIREGYPASEIRTVECDWFGAEENNQLAKMAEDGKLHKIYKSVLPLKIDVMRIAQKQFIFMPGEMFVEYSLMIKQEISNSYVVSLSNGVLYGYIVTEEAEKEGGYEASNSIFPAKSGKIMVKETLSLISDKTNNSK